MHFGLGRLTTGLIVSVLVLVGCSGDQDEEESKAEGAADKLAAALEAGDFGDVDLSGSTPKEVRKDYAATIEGMSGREPTVTVEKVEVAEDGDAATATLSWTWPVAEQEWSYESEAELSRSGDEWAVTWDRSVVEPSLTATSVLDATTVGGRRGDITGAGGDAIVTERPVVEVGVDRSQATLPEAVAAAEQVAAATDIDAAPYVKQVKAAGDQAFIRAITYRANDVPPAVAALDGTPGVLLLDGELPLARAQDRCADHRHGRRRHRGDDQGEPRPLRGGRPGRAVRTAEQVRRGAARQRRHRRAGDRGGRARRRSCSGWTPPTAPRWR